MTWPAAIVLASSQSAGRLFSDVMPWVLALIGATLVGAVAIYAIRRMLRSDPGTSNGFTLHDLRAMHASGELTDDEFTRAKAAMIGRLRSEVESDTLPSHVSSESDTSE